MFKPELVVDSNCIIGEGPVWDERDGKLYFIDILGRAFHCFDGEKIEKTITFDQSLGFAVLREKGGVIAGLQDGYFSVDFDGKPAVQIADPEPGRSEGRFNDGKVDPYGRVWGGTMPTALDTGYGEAGPDSGLYCMDENGNIKTMLKGVIQGNGLAWSADNKKFYFVDTQKHHVEAFDYDIEKNELSNMKVVLEVPAEEGIPDGMTIDDEGNLWLALWGGKSILHFNPNTGEIIDKVEIPALNVTSACFGGPNMDELFITTANLNTDKSEYPHCGGVFKIKPGVTGVKSYRYKG